MATNYEERYCAFIDFLGFSDAVKRSSASGPSDILAALKMAKDVAKTDNDITVTQFSDSLILSASADQEAALVSMIWAARLLSFELARHDVLLRGGLTKGKMYHKDNFAFGPAFIRAYQLEQAASTPRIILDKGLEEKLSFSSELSTDELQKFKNALIPVDFDGWRYVDYLSLNEMSAISDEESLFEGHHQRLRALVHRALVKNFEEEINPSLVSKYGWLDSKLKEAARVKIVAT